MDRTPRFKWSCLWSPNQCRKQLLIRSVFASGTHADLCRRLPKRLPFEGAEKLALRLYTVYYTLYR
jgi:hypothetical protein